MRILCGSLICFLTLVPRVALAGDVRERTRPANSVPTTITESQASDLTLTLTEVSYRMIQTWIRTAGRLDSVSRTVTAFVESPDADLVRVGQRVRSFPVEFISQMNQAMVTSVDWRDGGALVEVTLASQAPRESSNYLLEIITERGPFLSIPNVSIIEEEDEHVVYIQTNEGEYSRRAIEIGLQGELYTQVLEGLTEGDQVVSIGSFFVDAQNKLEAAGMAAMPNMDHGSMPGMEHDLMSMEQSAASSVQSITTAPIDSGLLATESRLMMTDPAAGSNVQAPLPMIHLMFNIRVNPEQSRFEVMSGDGSVVKLMPPILMGNEGNILMAIPTSPLQAGNYTVKWRTIDARSQTLEGQFSFSVR